MEHPYFKQYHDSSDEPICATPDVYSEIEGDFSIEQWKEMIWQEIVAFQEHRGKERLKLAAEFYMQNQQMPTPKQQF